MSVRTRVVGRVERGGTVGTALQAEVPGGKALHYGIDLVQWMVAWYVQAEQELEAGGGAG